MEVHIAPHLLSSPLLNSCSLHGTNSTLQESQDFLVEHLTKYNAFLYCIFSKVSSTGTSLEEPGELLGQMVLGQKGPTLPPPPPPNASQVSKPLNHRTLGYAFRKSAWGKGYASEASRALIDAYLAYIEEEKKKGKELFFVEGTWGPKNPASGRVLTKLGMKEVGAKVEELGPVFLGGEWQDPWYWVRMPVSELHVRHTLTPYLNIIGVRNVSLRFSSGG
jgi:RimJ/RimL family protein N-acetyltransferase